MKFWDNMPEKENLDGNEILMVGDEAQRDNPLRVIVSKLFRFFGIIRKSAENQLELHTPNSTGDAAATRCAKFAAGETYFGVAGKRAFRTTGGANYIYYGGANSDKVAVEINNTNVRIKDLDGTNRIVLGSDGDIVILQKQGKLVSLNNSNGVRVVQIKSDGTPALLDSSGYEFLKVGADGMVKFLPRMLKTNLESFLAVSDGSSGQVGKVAINTMASKQQLDSLGGWVHSNFYKKDHFDALDENGHLDLSKLDNLVSEGIFKIDNSSDILTGAVLILKSSNDQVIQYYFKRTGEISARYISEIDYEDPDNPVNVWSDWVNISSGDGAGNYVLLTSATPQTITSDLVLGAGNALRVTGAAGAENAFKYAQYNGFNQQEVGSTADMMCLNSKSIMLFDPATGGDSEVALRLDYKAQDGTTHQVAIPTSESLNRKVIAKVVSMQNQALANGNTVQLITTQQNLSYTNWVNAFDSANNIVPKYNGLLTIEAKIQFTGSSTSTIVTVTPQRYNSGTGQYDDLTVDSLAMSYTASSGRPQLLAFSASGDCTPSDLFRLKIAASGAQGTIVNTDIKIECEYFAAAE